MKLLLIIICAIIFAITVGIAIKPISATPQQHCWRDACKTENNRQVTDTEIDTYTPVINIWGYD